MTSPAHIFLDLAPKLAGELFSEQTLARLRACGVVTPRPSDPNTRLECDVLVTGWGSAPLPRSLPVPGRPRLLVHSAGTIKGLVSRDLLAAGLRVSQASAGMATSVAELATSFTLTLLRDLHHSESLTRRTRDWTLPMRRPLPRTVAGATVGVVGASRVGRSYITAMAGMGATVWVYDPYVNTAEISALGGRACDLEDLLRWCDVVALHAPVTDETRGMIGRSELALIRDGGIVVNTGRAALLDSDALLDELVSDRLSAGLDVFDVEPLPAHHPLWGLPNVVLTPHIGALTTHSRRAQGDIVVDEVEAFVTGAPLRHEVQLATYDLVA